MPTVAVHPFRDPDSEFSQVHRALWDVVMRECTGNEFKLLMFVFRQTMGAFPNPCETVSLTDREALEGTGFKDRKTLRKAAEGLTEKGFLVWTHGDWDRTDEYGLNLDCEVLFETSEPRPKSGRKSQANQEATEGENPQNVGENPKQSGRKSTESGRKSQANQESTVRFSPTFTSGPFHGGEKIIKPLTHESGEKPLETEKSVYQPYNRVGEVGTEEHTPAAPNGKTPNAPRPDPAPEPDDPLDSLFAAVAKECRQGELRTVNDLGRLSGSMLAYLTEAGDKLHRIGVETEQIPIFAARWRKKNPNKPLNPNHFLNHWEEIVGQDRPPPSAADREALKRQREEQDEADTTAFIERKRAQINGQKPLGQTE